MKVTLTIRLTLTNNNNDINNKRLMSLLMPVDFNIGNVFLFVKKSQFWERTSCYILYEFYEFQVSVFTWFCFNTKVNIKTKTHQKDNGPWLVLNQMKK